MARRHKIKIKTPHEIGIHPGQARLHETYDENARHVMALAAPGGGKTEGINGAAAGLGLWFPGKPAGMVAPTQARRTILWDKYLKLVRPFGWIDEVRPGRQELLLANGTLLQFVAAKKQGTKTGSPLAGRDWAWACVDEQQDIDDEALDAEQCLRHINLSRRRRTRHGRRRPAY